MQKFKSLISKKKKKNNQPTLTIKKCSILSPHSIVVRRGKKNCQSFQRISSFIGTFNLSLCLSLSLLRIFLYLSSFFSDQFFPWFVNSPQTIRRKDRTKFLVNCFLFFILVLGEWKHKGK